MIYPSLSSLLGKEGGRGRPKLTTLHYNSSLRKPEGPLEEEKPLETSRG
jgi:hypothetical protein